jgi:16S rRNA (cytidine1402-2'-O)-methyltransferase
VSLPPAPRGTLYVVGTPIGNLEDLSPRAVSVLGTSRVVACEDTRTTRALMTRHGLKTRLVSYHRFNEAERAESLLAVLRRGESVALVTDGGTPGISDPGALLVRRAREEGHRVVPVPGPSAITALLSASGFPPGPFTFVGFLPHRKGERRRRLEELRQEGRPLLFFEAPHRLLASLDDVLEILGDREAFLGREMTKVHEELVSGRLSALRAGFSGRQIRGEVAFLVQGALESAGRGGQDAGEPAAGGPGGVAGAGEPPAATVRRLMEAGWDRKEAMRRVARERGISRREVYQDMLRGRKGAP